jgi:acetylornithine deacetylase
MTDPFSAEVRGGRLYGRGAYDMKGALAACIGATHALRSAGIRLAGDVVIAAVADEEHASLGTQALLARYPVDGAIVTEPTANRLCVAHKGFVWAAFTTRGRAAHGSRPDLGIDANLRMGRILARLSDLATALDDGPRHPLLGPGSIHAATLHGGTGLSTYAADCRLGVERRTLPGESGARVMADLAALLDALRAEDPAFDGSLEHLLTREPFEARPDSAIAACLERAAGQVLGRVPDRVGETPWMDAALLSSVGIDTVVFGPHGEGAHAAVEWVELESVFQCAEVLARTAIEYCGIREG